MPLKSRLREIAARIDEPIETGVDKAADYVVDLASQFAPYDETENHKHLNESIEKRPGPTRTDRLVVAGVGLPDPRAEVQERGSIYQEPQPYLAPAIQAIDVKREVRDAIREWIKQFKV